MRHPMGLCHHVVTQTEMELQQVTQTEMELQQVTQTEMELQERLGRVRSLIYL